MTTGSELRNVHGSCHCRAVRFSARLDLGGAFRCNCSICLKAGSTVVACSPSDFTLISGEADLFEYSFGPRILTRFICRHCGVLCFARGIGPGNSPMVGVNVNTLDDVEVSVLRVVYFDGRHDRFEPQPAPMPMFYEPA
jgi:hypothetical protein